MGSAPSRQVTATPATPSSRRAAALNLKTSAQKGTGSSTSTRPTKTSHVTTVIPARSRRSERRDVLLSCNARATASLVDRLAISGERRLRFGTSLIYEQK